MAWQVVDTSGMILVGTTSGSPSDVFDGTGVNNASLRRSTRTITVQPIGSTYQQEDVTGKSYELQATITVPTTATSGLLAAGDTVYGTYKSATGTTLFAGDCIVAEVSDTQNENAYGQQAITLRSTGAPDVG